MAAPHVAGLVALLWSAGPHLIGDVDVTEWLIRHSARPVVDLACGGDADGHPNNVYGWGIVDAMAAIQGELRLTGSAEPRLAQAGGRVTYTFSVSNTAVLSPATSVVLSDSLPLSTTFASAGGAYSQVGNGVVWDLGTIPSNESITTTLAVTLNKSLPLGSIVINADYAVRSGQVPTVVMGTPITVTIPWRLSLPITYKNTP
jgi:uncharacterized repeat protein (TIGR01451 family)